MSVAPIGGCELLRVAERALLVRFLDADLPAAVAKAQALAMLVAGELQDFSVSSKDEGKDKRLPVKGEGGASAEGEGASLEVQKAPSEQRGPGAADRPRGKTSIERSPASTESLGAFGLAPRWSGECVPGAGNLLVLLSASTTSAAIEICRQRIESLIPKLSLSEGEGSRLASEEVVGLEREETFAVRYGGEEGPDLEAVAREAGVSAERVVELHAGASYRVAFLGFSPGFAYLLGLPRELERPRLALPRERVAAGSVAVAGPFSAVYPSATPGGWRLLGRLADAAPRLFDPGAAAPARLAPGDRVRFRPVR